MLDTKWKRLDATDRANKYGLSQAELYQLFAYGMKYLGSGGGELALVFPRCDRFRDSLPVFDFGHGLSLRVLPFDLDAEDLIGAASISLPLVQGATAATPIGAIDPIAISSSAAEPSASPPLQQ